MKFKFNKSFMNFSNFSLFSTNTVILYTLALLLFIVDMLSIIMLLADALVIMSSRLSYALVYIKISELYFFDMLLFHLTFINLSSISIIFLYFSCLLECPCGHFAHVD